MNRLYVLTRKDLRCSSSAVQAGHALAEFLLHRPTTSWDNGTLIFLGIENEKELEKWCWKLDRKKIDWVGFREPDLDNELTAIALVLEDGKIFKNLKLL